MKIADVLKRYPEDYRIKIGSQDGNGYFYCGNVADWNKNCDHYSEKLYKHIQEKCVKARNNSTSMIRNFCEEVLQVSKDGKTVPDSFVSVIDNYILKIAQVINTKNNSKKRFESFKPIKDRDVIDYFEADLAVEYPECLVILVEGSESGKFWDATEVKDEPLGINAFVENMASNAEAANDSKKEL